MDDLIFDSEKHIYTYKGNRFPSVTQVLEPLKNFDNVSSAIMARAIEYGSNVHESIRLAINYDLNLDTLDEALKLPVNEFINWLDNRYRVDITVTDIFFNNKSFASWKLKYAGTPDICIAGDAIIEIKTRKVDHCVDDLQVCAYEHLAIANLNCNENYQKILIELLPGQPLKEYRVKNKQAWPLFRRCLDRWWSEYEFNNLIERWKKNG